MRRDSFNVLFFIKKTKLLKNGEASVCMRITVNGARVETNIRKSIEPVSWNQAKECARGKSRKSTELHQTPPNLYATRREWGTYHSPNIAGKVLRGGQKGGASTHHHRHNA